MTKKGVGEEEKANSEDPMIWKLTQEGGKDKEMLKRYAQVSCLQEKHS